MLGRLVIENFIIIDFLEIEFSKGLNVITGETGAGKSIILNALKIVLGEKAAAELIGPKKNQCIIEALFIFEENNLEMANVLGEHGISMEKDGLLLLQREINRSGKNFCRINNRLVTLSVYKNICLNLVSFHKQNEQQTLLSADKQLELLDSLGDDNFLSLKKHTSDSYYSWHKIKKQLETINKNSKDTARRIDILEFQIEEIKQAQLSPKEDMDLQNQLTILNNIEKIMTLSDEIYSMLYAGNNQQLAVTDLLGEIDKKWHELNKIDSSLADWHTKIEEFLYYLEDAARAVKGYQDNLQYDPQQVEIIEQRLMLIKNLQNKYGDNIENILEFLASAEKELNQLKEIVYNGENLIQQEEEEFLIYQNNAQKIHEQRLLLGKDLEKKILKELTELEMKDARFKVELTKSEPNSKGVDKTAFLVSFNKGQNPKPIEKVASGGEISRLMLSIKTILTSIDQYFTIILDEIDSGVGGNALQAVVEKLGLLSSSKQVICITHAPQLAAAAANHIFVFKKNVKDRTVTNVKSLNAEEKRKEIARMLDGDKITSLTLEHADQMIKNS